MNYKIMRNWIKELLYRFRGEYTTETLIKRGMIVGRNFHRMQGTILDPGHCWLIEIGDNVTIAPRVHILCHDACTKIFLDYTRIGRVIIGNNVFIGAESVILPNVKIGNNVIIGANSTVTRNVQDNVVIAGCPAKTICSLDEFLEREKSNMASNPIYDKSYTLGGKIKEFMKKKQSSDLENIIGYIK